MKTYQFYLYDISECFGQEASKVSSHAWVAENNYKNFPSRLSHSPEIIEFSEKSKNIFRDYDQLYTLLSNFSNEAYNRSLVSHVWKSAISYGKNLRLVFPRLESAEISFNQLPLFKDFKPSKEFNVEEWEKEIVTRKLLE